LPTVSGVVEEAERRLAEGQTDVLELLVLFEAPEARGLARALRDRGTGDERFLGAVALYRLGDRGERTRRTILERVEAARTEPGAGHGTLLDAGGEMLFRPHHLTGRGWGLAYPPRHPHFWSLWVSLEPEIRGEARTPLPEESALFGERDLSMWRAWFIGDWSRKEPYWFDAMPATVRKQPQAAARLAEAYRRAGGRDDLMRGAVLYRVLSESRDRPDGAMAHAYLESLNELAVRYGDDWGRKAFLEAIDRIGNSRDFWRSVPDKETLLRFWRELRDR
ncbi:MAG: hypothetical protein ACYTDY_12925, partial [Planctomycetota bacterium]